MSEIAVLHAYSSTLDDVRAIVNQIDSGPLPSLMSCDAELPENASGLLIMSAERDLFPDVSQEIIHEALSARLPILASGGGMHLLNQVMGGGAASIANHLRVGSSQNGSKAKKSIFLAPGAKVSSTIGGSGWLSIGCDHRLGIEQSAISDALMTACISDDRFVEAFEAPGHRWVIGVQWDVMKPDSLPRGFENLLLAFIERSAGIE